MRLGPAILWLLAPVTVLVDSSAAVSEVGACSLGLAFSWNRQYVVGTALKNTFPHQNSSASIPKWTMMAKKTVKMVARLPYH